MDLNSAYLEAIGFTKKHYENFPVVSILVPKSLRKHIAIIYWFARTADDIADEGSAPAKERLKKLEEFEIRFTELLRGKYASSFELALHSTIKSQNLSPDHFYDLLKAFKQDVVKKRYENFTLLLEYCKHSANPVGRLILELNQIKREEIFGFSDNICTALQLTNFWQDTVIDYKKGRIYYPKDDMENFGVKEKMFELNENNLNLMALVKHNVEKTEEIFNEGEKLIKYLSGRLKYEIKWTVLGGKYILKRIGQNDYDVLRQRPSLTKIDFLILLLKSFL